jgi:hypothetical protein
MGRTATQVEELPHYQLTRAGELGETAERLCNETSLAMGGVAAWFVVHAGVQFCDIAERATRSRSMAPLAAAGGCVDELIYAYLISAASTHFAAIAATQGNDLDHLVSGVGETRRLWRKMQKPLIVKSLLMLISLLWRVRSDVVKAAARAMLQLVGYRSRFRGKSEVGPRALASPAQGGYVSYTIATAMSLIESFLEPVSDAV